MGGWDRVNSDLYNKKNINFEMIKLNFLSFNNLRLDIIRNVSYKNRKYYFCSSLHLSSLSRILSSYNRNNDVLVAHIEGDGGLYNLSVYSFKKV